MDERELELQSFIRTVEEKSKAVRRRAFIITLLPVVVGVVLLAAISVLIMNATRELNDLQRQNKDLEQQNNDLKKELKASVNYVQHLSPVTWVDSKKLAFRDPTPFELFELIRHLGEKDLTWDIKNLPPGKGFNSPGFAAYVLDRMGVKVPANATSEQLLKFTQPVSSPMTGDLAFYDGGFVMFYFKKTKGVPFCIGMTPVGVISLEVNFGARLIGYGRVKYPRRAGMIPP
ncbi:MAG: hypothetical protein JXD23_04365 [Spirochaetales bacterium]|nr:hypothetical protein [Spirochaetales bacterium]